MKEQFCTYEIAKQLKELGFNEECFGWWYWINGKVANFYDYKISNSQLIKLNSHKNNCSAPLWQQAISFLKIKHNILIAELWDGWEMAKEGDDFVVYKEINEAILKTIKIIKEQNEKS